MPASFCDLERAAARLPGADRIEGGEIAEVGGQAGELRLERQVAVVDGEAGQGQAFGGDILGEGGGAGGAVELFGHIDQVGFQVAGAGFEHIAGDDIGDDQFVALDRETGDAPALAAKPLIGSAAVRTEAAVELGKVEPALAAGEGVGVGEWALGREDHVRRAVGEHAGAQLGDGERSGPDRRACRWCNRGRSGRGSRRR